MTLIVRPGGSGVPPFLFMGTPGDFSVIVLEGLLEAGFAPRAVVVPGPEHGSIPVVRRDRLCALAESAGAPVVPIPGFRGDALERLARHAPELVLVACFPYLLPGAALRLPRLGAFNLHPSLLPAYRGPSPLFWQFRCGERRSGVTLHRMSERADAGEVLAQEALAVRAGAAASELNAQLARRGAGLLADMLRRLARGEPLRLEPQNERASSYFSWPRGEDFEMTTRWSAERAFRFICGTREWGHGYRVHTPSGVLHVRSARGYRAAGTLPVDYRREGGGLHIRFAPGVLTVPAQSASI